MGTTAFITALFCASLLVNIIQWHHADRLEAELHGWIRQAMNRPPKEKYEPTNRIKGVKWR